MRSGPSIFPTSLVVPEHYDHLFDMEEVNHDCLCSILFVNPWLHFISVEGQESLILCV